MITTSLDKQQVNMEQKYNHNHSGASVCHHIINPGHHVSFAETSSSNHCV
jgi:hypothetical protein